MATPTKQVRLPFERLTEANLKPIIKKFEKHGVKFAEVDAPNKAKRESGALVKEVTFTVEDGQKILIRCKADGTVFQVKLNKKPVPIRSVDDMDKAIIEIVDYVQGNAKAYERAKLNMQKRKLQPTPPSIVTSRQEKLAAARSALEGVAASSAELREQEAGIQSELTNKSAELDRVTRELETEKEKTVTLEAELKSLQSSVALGA